MKCPGLRAVGGGGVVIFKYIISRAFNYVEQNGYFRILIGCVLGKGVRGRGGGLFALQSLFTIKKYTSCFNY